MTSSKLEAAPRGNWLAIIAKARYRCRERRITYKFTEVGQDGAGNNLASAVRLSQPPPLLLQSAARHFNLDKLTELFRNFVCYENTNSTNSSTCYSFRTRLPGAFTNGAGRQSTARRRLPRRQHRGGLLSSLEPHWGLLQYGSWDLFASQPHRR
jgi:hypothetical protein